MNTINCVLIPGVNTCFDHATGERRSVHDFGPARVYGELHKLNPAPFSSDLAPEIENIRNFFGSEVGRSGCAILCAGPPGLVGAAIHYACLANPESPVRLLNWDKKSSLYRLLEIEL